MTTGPPIPNEASKHGKIFGLPKTVVKKISEQVISAAEQWPEYAQNNDVSEKDHDNIRRVLQY